jgi:hypothetical protein
MQMKHMNPLLFLTSVFFLLMWGLVSCESLPEESPIPEDLSPAITILAPATNNFLAREGEPVSVTFRLADNEALNVFRVVGRVFDQQGNVVGTDFIETAGVSGTLLDTVYTYVVPAGFQPYYRIRFTVYAIDTKGASADALFWVNIIPQEGAPSPYKVLTYRNRRTFSRLAPIAYAFNFTSRDSIPANNVPGGQIDRDIEESSRTGNNLFPPVPSAFAPKLISPNNQLLGVDSVFVVTNAARFNYEEATYNSLYQAFFSDALPSPETPVLKVGDYVIVRLIKAPQPQFAIMKITEVQDVVGVADFIRFDYKVTTQ